MRRDMNCAFANYYSMACYEGTNDRREKIYSLKKINGDMPWKKRLSWFRESKIA